MIDLVAKLSISRPQGGDCNGEFIDIQVNDEAAGVRAVTVRVSLADFAKALTGQGHIPATLEFNDSGLVGMVREYRKKAVPSLEHLYGDDRASRVRAALVPYEVDGWRGSDSDMSNSHCTSIIDGKRFQAVGFQRHVPRK